MKKVIAQFLLGYFLLSGAVAAASGNDETSLEEFLYRGWKNAKQTDLLSLLKERDKDGSTVLMKFSSWLCGPKREFELPASCHVGPEINTDRSGKLNAYKRLLGVHPDLEARDKAGRTAYMYALYFGCEKEAKALMAAGAKTNIKDNRGAPAASYAIKGKLDDLAKVVLLNKTITDFYA